MIHKLRRKFILINMALVSLVMIIVFISIGVFSYQSLKNESLGVLRRTVERDIGMTPPPLEIGKKMEMRHTPLIPVFSVVTDASGTIVSVFKENLEVSDSVVSDVTKRALSSGKTEGTLMDMDLRFMVRNTGSGFRLAFADTANETTSITRLLLTLLIVGAGGLAAFFAISMFLSEWALRPARKAWEQQRRFVADASHELKTPLTVILANMGILMSNRNDSIVNQEKWVLNTQAEANRMKKLVDDLLFLAKSDGSEIPLIKGRVDISDAVWSSILPFESVAYEQGVELRTDIEPDMQLVGDEGQLKQLIMILLDNGCKYAGNKGIVDVSLKRYQNTGVMKITNTGIPIPREHLDHVFDRFYRVEASRVRAVGGYGLGLSIAKTIVESHGGKISVESSEAEGTTFTVSLPLAAVIQN
jgi:two-component system, OmpR family, sensor histidine kinase CiaH